MDKKFDDRMPIYLQIMDLIKKDIVTYKLKCGDKLPSVREMAANLKVNPNTLQRSYQELERLEIVYTQRGMGTFVSDDITMVNTLKLEMVQKIVDSFIFQMESLGYSENEIINSINLKIREV
ncbi:GntR family transcriptional regulator [Clostridium sp.]|uniref:GntR family transcriptional regulator n=1 Tax=Clostridium sp. TaxID=1506 RepID=UPI001A3F4DC2|nr:GntR family transcriptional regulator [Clostridium sp.]MBK5240970.1 GntR family transcriptional regulator [Clostridium sp.]